MAADIAESGDGDQKKAEEMTDYCYHRTRLTVSLNRDEIEALKKSAKQDRRTAREQAAMLIRWQLIHLGLLQESDGNAQWSVAGEEVTAIGLIEQTDD